MDVDWKEECKDLLDVLNIFLSREYSEVGRLRRSVRTRSKPKLRLNSDTSSEKEERENRVLRNRSRGKPTVRYNDDSESSVDPNYVIYHNNVLANRQSAIRRSRNTTTRSEEHHQNVGIRLNRKTVERVPAKKFHLMTTRLRIASSTYCLARHFAQGRHRRRPKLVRLNQKEQQHHDNTKTHSYKVN